MINVVIMKLITTNEAKKKLCSYDTEERVKIQKLRKLIIESARELKIDTLEETLKWGELSYIVKNGSTIRIDTRAQKTGDYAMYFKCTSKLVSTFKKVHGETFTYEKNRAIVFSDEDTIPTREVKICIELALKYHEVKHLKLLGVK